LQSTIYHQHSNMLSRSAVLLLLAAEAAQAFVGAPALPTTVALHRPVYSLQMLSTPDCEGERSLKTRVATNFAALVSALVVGTCASLPQASHAKTAAQEKAPATSTVVFAGNTKASDFT
jgi:hypothetical protein